MGASFDEWGVARSEEGRRLALGLYQQALNRFIEHVNRLADVDAWKEFEVQVVIERVYGSLAEGRGRLGVFPVSWTFEQAEQVLGQDKRDPATGQIKIDAIASQLPSDIDLSLRIQMSRIPPEDLIDSVREAISQIRRQLFDEFGVLIQIGPHQEEGFGPDFGIPIRQAQGKGLLNLFSHPVSPAPDAGPAQHQAGSAWAWPPDDQLRWMDQELFADNDLIKLEGTATVQHGAPRTVEVVTGFRHGDPDKTPCYLRVGPVTVVARDVAIPPGVPRDMHERLLRVEPEALTWGIAAVPMIAAMLQWDLRGEIVEDDGIGQGLLALIALKLGGARRVIGIDYDERKLDIAYRTLSEAGFHGRRPSGTAWRWFRADAQDQFVLIHDDFNAWFRSWAMLRDRVCGGRPAIRLASLGAEYLALHTSLVRFVAAERRPIPAILGGYFEDQPGTSTYVVRAEFPVEKKLVWRFTESNFFDASALTLAPWGSTLTRASPPASDAGPGSDEALYEFGREAWEVNRLERLAQETAEAVGESLGVQLKAIIGGGLRYWQRGNRRDADILLYSEQRPLTDDRLEQPFLEEFRRRIERLNGYALEPPNAQVLYPQLVAQGAGSPRQLLIDVVVIRSTEPLPLATLTRLKFNAKDPRRRTAKALLEISYYIGDDATHHRMLAEAESKEEGVFMEDWAGTWEALQAQLSDPGRASLNLERITARLAEPAHVPPSPSPTAAPAPSGVEGPPAPTPRGAEETGATPLVWGPAEWSIPQPATGTESGTGTGVAAPERLFHGTLVETFGASAIQSVFDVGTGRGEWMRAIQGQPWLAPGARIVGFKPDPIEYYEQEPRWSPDEHWQGLTVVRKRADPAYPAPGAVELLHGSFLGFIEDAHLDAHDRLVRDGGWFAYAGNDYDLPRDRIISWLERRGYPFRVYEQNEVPPDYPVSRWWNQFLKAQQRGEPEETNYLIIARKQVSAAPNAAPPAPSGGTGQDPGDSHLGDSHLPSAAARPDPSTAARDSGALSEVEGPPIRPAEALLSVLGLETFESIPGEEISIAAAIETMKQANDNGPWGGRFTRPDTEFPAGTRVRRIRIPPQEPHEPGRARGLALLRQELGPTDTFDLLINQLGRVIAVFPVLTDSTGAPLVQQPDEIKLTFFDLSPFHVAVRHLGAAGAAAEWDEFSKQYTADQQAIEAYGNRLTPFWAFDGEVVRNAHGSPYVHAVLDRRTGELTMNGFRPDRINPYRWHERDPNLAEAIIPIFPTIYDPADAEHRAADHLYHSCLVAGTRHVEQYVAALIARFAPRPGERVFVFGPGSGLDSWLAWLATGETVFARDSNAIADANLRVTAAINGFSVDTTSVPSGIDVMVGNLPWFELESSRPSRPQSGFRASHDRDYGGRALAEFADWFHRTGARRGFAWNTPRWDGQVPEPKDIVLEHFTSAGLQAEPVYHRSDNPLLVDTLFGLQRELAVYFLTTPLGVLPAESGDQGDSHPGEVDQGLLGAVREEIGRLAAGQHSRAEDDPAYQNTLRQGLARSPATVRQVMREIFAHPAYLARFEGFVDTVVLEANAWGVTLRIPGEHARRAEHPFTPTSLETIRQMLEILHLGPDDTFCDIGSGPGSVVLPVALVSDVGRVIGIDVVPELIQRGRTISSRLGLKHVAFTEKNAQDLTLDDLRGGTVFYLYHPFYYKTWAHVARLLGQLAQEQYIRVVSVGQPDGFYNQLLAEQPSLSQVDFHPGPGQPFVVFESADPSLKPPLTGQGQGQGDSHPGDSARELPYADRTNSAVLAGLLGPTKRERRHWPGGGSDRQSVPATVEPMDTSQWSGDHQRQWEHLARQTEAYPVGKEPTSLVGRRVRLAIAAWSQQEGMARQAMYDRIAARMGGQRKTLKHLIDMWAIGKQAVSDEKLAELAQGCRVEPIWFRRGRQRQDALRGVRPQLPSLSRGQRCLALRCVKGVSREYLVGRLQREYGLQIAARALREFEDGRSANLNDPRLWKALAGLLDVTPMSFLEGIEQGDVLATRTTRECIEALSLAQGLTERALADRLGVTQALIQQWKRSGVPAHRRASVANALGVSPGDLFSEEREALLHTVQAIQALASGRENQDAGEELTRLLGGARRAGKPLFTEEQIHRLMAPRRFGTRIDRMALLGRLALLRVPDRPKRFLFTSRMLTLLLVSTRPPDDLIEGLILLGMDGFSGGAITAILSGSRPSSELRQLLRALRDCGVTGSFFRRTVLTAGRDGAELLQDADALSGLQRHHSGSPLPQSWLVRALMEPERTREAFRVLLEEGAALPPFDAVLTGRQKAYLRLRSMSRNLPPEMVLSLAAWALPGTEAAAIWEAVVRQRSDDEARVTPWFARMRERPGEGWTEPDYLEAGRFLLSLNPLVRERAQQALLIAHLPLLQKRFDRPDDRAVAEDQLLRVSRQFNVYTPLLEDRTTPDALPRFRGAVADRGLVQIKTWEENLPPAERRIRVKIHRVRHQIRRETGTAPTSDEIVQALTARGEDPSVIRRILENGSVASFDDGARSHVTAGQPLNGNGRPLESWGTFYSEEPEEELEREPISLVMKASGRSEAVVRQIRELIAQQGQPTRRQMQAVTELLQSYRGPDESLLEKIRQVLSLPDFSKGQGDRHPGDTHSAAAPAPSGVEGPPAPTPKGAEESSGTPLVWGPAARSVPQAVTGTGKSTASVDGANAIVQWLAPLDPTLPSTEDDAAFAYGQVSGTGLSIKTAAITLGNFEPRFTVSGGTVASLGTGSSDAELRALDRFLPGAAELIAVELVANSVRSLAKAVAAEAPALRNRVQLYHADVRRMPRLASNSVRLAVGIGLGLPGQAADELDEIVRILEPDGIAYLILDVERAAPGIYETWRQRLGQHGTVLIAEDLNTSPAYLSPAYIFKKAAARPSPEGKEVPSDPASGGGAEGPPDPAERIATARSLPEEVSILTRTIETAQVYVREKLGGRAWCFHYAAELKYQLARQGIQSELRVRQGQGGGRHVSVMTASGFRLDTDPAHIPWTLYEQLRTAGKYSVDFIVLASDDPLQAAYDDQSMARYYGDSEKAAGMEELILSELGHDGEAPPADAGPAAEQGPSGSDPEAGIPRLGSDPSKKMLGLVMAALLGLPALLQAQGSGQAAPIAALLPFIGTTMLCAGYVLTVMIRWVFRHNPQNWSDQDFRKYLSRLPLTSYTFSTIGQLILLEHFEGSLEWPVRAAALVTIALWPVMVPATAILIADGATHIAKLCRRMWHRRVTGVVP
jgi:predicted RNA methylase/transcriptional regulator with XRE-family HTH domain